MVSEEIRMNLTPPVILRELESLAGLPRNSTELHVGVADDRFWLLWNVDGRRIRMPHVDHEALALSLDEFSKQHCEPAIAIMRAGRG